MKEDLNSASQLGWGHSEAAPRCPGTVRSQAVLAVRLGSFGASLAFEVVIRGGDTKIPSRGCVSWDRSQVDLVQGPSWLVRVSWFSRPHSGSPTFCVLPSSLPALSPPSHVCSIRGFRFESHLTAFPSFFHLKVKSGMEKSY